MSEKTAEELHADALAELDSKLTGGIAMETSIHERAVISGPQEGDTATCNCEQPIVFIAPRHGEPMWVHETGNAECVFYATPEAEATPAKPDGIKLPQKTTGGNRGKD